MTSFQVLSAIFALFLVVAAAIPERSYYYGTSTDRYLHERSGRHRAGPTPGKPPVDIDGEITTLEQVIGMISGGAGNLVAGLTGISTADCANQIKGDLSRMTCAQFLQQLSQCESMVHVKQLVQAAKRNFKKNPNSKQPCFQ